MCDKCGCTEGVHKAIRYKCQVDGDPCIISFGKDPKATPHCCGKPMKLVN
ncbi:MAG: hypothetical protein AB1665_03240 [Candidatus Thermoplasmatota archaeon]